MKIKIKKPYRVRMLYTTLLDFGTIDTYTKENAIEQAEIMLANNVKIKEELGDPEWKLYVKSKKYKKETTND